MTTSCRTGCRGRAGFSAPGRNNRDHSVRIGLAHKPTRSWSSCCASTCTSAIWEPANKGQEMARKAGATSDTIAAANEKVEKEVARRKRTVRSFPAAPFEETIDFVKSMFEFGSGEAVRRLSLFDHIG